MKKIILSLIICLMFAHHAHAGGYNGNGVYVRYYNWVNDQRNVLFSEGSFYAPASFNAHGNYFLRNASFSLPISYAQFFVQKFKKMVVSSIVCLNDFITPFAIIWLIASFVINSIKGLVWFRHSHIGKKVLKRISPAAANGDSSCSVPNEALTFRIMASVFHGLPNRIYATSLHAVGCISSYRYFTVKAAARFIATINKIVFRNISFSTALTNTPDIEFLFVGRAQNGPPSECLIRGIQYV